MSAESTSNFFAIISFVISIGLAISFFVSNLIKDWLYHKKVKNIIKNNILQLTKIYDRIYVDVDEITGIRESDQRRISEIVLYFARKHTRIEMIRINIENQLAHLTKKDAYHDSVDEILEDLDTIMEKCYNPKLPLKYQLAVWQNNNDLIKATTKNTVNVATKQLKIIK